MAGDSVRAAFRSRLATHRAAAGVAWAIKDTDNTGENPDASAQYLELEFPGGAPTSQYTLGNPGNNLHEEVGQVTLRVVTPLGSNRDTAEEYAEALRMKFIADRIPYATNRAIKILGASPISDGHTEGGMYAYSVMLSYRVYLVA